MCEFVVNSFPFEIIMMGTAARRAGEPFVQQFLDKHSRSCWRPTPRYALFLRRVTPTPSDFSRADVAFVGVPLPAAPYFFVGSRQRGPTFPGRTSPLFAPPSPLRLIPPSGHANAVPLFPGGLRLCWRPPPRCALFLRLATPTPSGNSLTCWRIGVLENKKAG